MAKALTCNLCKKEGKEFIVPAGDGIGEAIMLEHLWGEHKIKVATGKDHERADV